MSGRKSTQATVRICGASSDGGQDVFVHISAVERAGLSGLPERQKVSYEIQVDRKRGKSSAENLRV
ncbi:cold-shock protein [Bradyrhizobium liaoningense]|uniref:cold-shock protein n=1 Tax=Bradyrhizobium liaoningense TaxID=43992 RepID=UPI001BA6E49A|nr:cold shock domain-containing protein [Bradyrhizobium liaoningense]MBR0883845.1 cold-shock protein [Bradyrhizobium liaoningense]